MKMLGIYPQQQRWWCSATGCRGGGQVCCVTCLVNYSCSVFCKVNYQLTFEYFKIYNVSLVFSIYVLVFIIVALIICLFQEVHYVLIQ